MIVYGPELFLNDGSVDKLTVFSKFRRLSFVVLSFCRFAHETEEPSTIQIFEFETRLAMIAMIAMATRLTQPKSAIEAQHVSQLVG